MLGLIFIGLAVWFSPSILSGAFGGISAIQSVEVARRVAQARAEILRQSAKMETGNGTV